MKRTITLGFLALTTSALFSACAGGPETPATPQIDALARALCDMSFRCCDPGEAAYYLGPYVDRDNCSERLVEQASRSSLTSIDLGQIAGLREGLLVIPSLPALNQAIGDGRVRIDEEALAACQDHIARETCNVFEEPPESDVCVPPEPAPQETPCDLEKIYIGRLLEGAECTSGAFSLECAPGLQCSVGFGLGITGRCVQQRRLNETCSKTSECARDLYCSQLDGSCQKYKKAGEVCVFADRNDPAPDPNTLLTLCEPHLSCDPISNTCVEACQPGAQCVVDDNCDEEQELLCIVGRCSKVRQAGQPCAVQEHCGEGLRCGDDPQNPGNLACLPGLELNSTCLVSTDCDSGYCDQSVSQCRAPAEIGEPCPSMLNDECAGGACVREAPTTACLDETDCPLSGTCDFFGSCGTYCIALKDDGATCTLDTECKSENCIAGTCATPPLLLGQACEQPTDCDSEFCNYETPRVCDELPLALGKPCFAGLECDTGVCFEGECTQGLPIGSDCDEPDQPPCDPKTAFCDTIDADEPVCAALFETGKACKSSVQCRGLCELRFGRKLCSPAVPEGKAICGGGGSAPPPSDDEQPE